MQYAISSASASQPRFGKQHEAGGDAHTAARRIRTASQGVPGEKMNPAFMMGILEELGFQPEHADKPKNKRFILNGVRVNFDRVHGDQKPSRHLDVEGLADHSKAKVYYLA